MNNFIQIQSYILQLNEIKDKKDFFLSLAPYELRVKKEVPLIFRGNLRRIVPFIYILLSVTSWFFKIRSPSLILLARTSPIPSTSSNSATEAL